MNFCAKKISLKVCVLVIHSDIHFFIENLMYTCLDLQATSNCMMNSPSIRLKQTRDRKRSTNSFLATLKETIHSHVHYYST